jgi:pyruvate/2-oxoglutarate dehydrogenase complex dihydrolipoamide acyltransferase (E2) component
MVHEMVMTLHFSPLFVVTRITGPGSMSVKALPSFNSRIEPLQVAIIGAGRSGQRVVVHEGQSVVRAILPLSLNSDHRVVNGGKAARFLMALKLDLERPS